MNRHQSALETIAALDCAGRTELHAEIYGIRKRLLGTRAAYAYLQSDVPEALREEVVQLARKGN